MASSNQRPHLQPGLASSAHIRLTNSQFRGVVDPNAPQRCRESSQAARKIAITASAVRFSVRGRNRVIIAGLLIPRVWAVPVLTLSPLL